MPVVNIDAQEANVKKPMPGASLVSHIMPIVQENRTIRDQLYKKTWDQYERTFLGS